MRLKNWVGSTTNLVSVGKPAREAVSHLAADQQTRQVGQLDGHLTAPTSGNGDPHLIAQRDDQHPPTSRLVDPPQGTNPLGRNGKRFVDAEQIG